jgi:hypothetical protein
VLAAELVVAVVLLREKSCNVLLLTYNDYHRQVSSTYRMRSINVTVEVEEALFDWGKKG